MGWRHFYAQIFSPLQVRGRRCLRTTLQQASWSVNPSFRGTFLQAGTHAEKTLARKGSSRETRVFSQGPWPCTGTQHGPFN